MFSKPISELESLQLCYVARRVSEFFCGELHRIDPEKVMEISRPLRGKPADIFFNFQENFNRKFYFSRGREREKLHLKTALNTGVMLRGFYCYHRYTRSLEMTFPPGQITSRFLIFEKRKDDRLSRMVSLLCLVESSRCLIPHYYYYFFFF